MAKVEVVFSCVKLNYSQGVSIQKAKTSLNYLNQLHKQDSNLPVYHISNFWQLALASKVEHHAQTATLVSKTSEPV